MLGLLALSALPVATALVPYAVLEQRSRAFWQGVPLPAVVVGDDPYRAALVPAGNLSRAPLLVRSAALSCMFMGQMFVPGVCLGLFGLAIYGLGLVSVPGLVVAARLWAASGNLLKGTPAGIAQARSAARWSVNFNVALTALCLMSAVAVLISNSGSPDPDNTSLLGYLALTQLYASGSIAQAALVDVATRRLGGNEGRRENVWPRWLLRSAAMPKPYLAPLNP